MISGHASIEDAVRATRLGAFDFLEKPLDRNRVVVTVRNAAERRRMLRQVSSLRAAVDSASDAYAAALAAAERWVGEVALTAPPPVAAVASTGPGWAAALEAALLLKEVARVPAEGVETREGATSVLMGLTGEALLVLLPTLPDDPLLDECDALARSSGIATLRTPTVAGADPRLAAITTFPATLALAIAWGLHAGHDVDQPAWTQAYYATARRK